MSKKLLLISAIILDGLALWVLISLYAGPRHSPAAPAAATPAASPAAAAEPSGPAKVRSAAEKELAPAADLPACDFRAFAASADYKPVVSRQADFFSDGGREWLIGYRSSRLDEMGYPAEEAYFTLARYDAAAGRWQEWFSIPAPGGEGEIDARSIVAVDDINRDGVTEAVLQFYGFGVSSRPVNTYVFHITREGADAASSPSPIEGTSDDVVRLTDASAYWPGEEIVQARALMGHEAHAAPHHYQVVVWAWSKGKYRSMDTLDTVGTYRDGALAIQEAVGMPAGD